MFSVTVGGPGLVAVGWDGLFLEDTDAAVWTSPDAVSWSRAPHDEKVFGGTVDQSMLSVTAVGPGLWRLWAGWIVRRLLHTGCDMCASAASSRRGCALSAWHPGAGR